MASNLVIVESPAKAKTIEKILGKDFKVESSYGHIADLPENEMGIDIEQNFQVKYTVSDRSKPQVAKLKSLSNKADTIWLASDEDREGEAISWHLMETLELDVAKTKRIVFNSITKSAIEKAIQNPRSINIDLVNAQQARRVLDRIVGYELSPVLWKKIKPGLSAGRVQSVAVRLIVEREREIQDFKTEVSFRLKAVFSTEKGQSFEAKLGKTFKTAEEAAAFLNDLSSAEFSIDALEKKPAKRAPSAPFTTSTLQQEASRKLYFPVRKTMQVAQRLYEAGLITYMRTDSVNLSSEALQSAQKAITEQFGGNYAKQRKFSSKSKGAQEAHEAIRPTNFEVTSIAKDRDQDRLYELIYKRALASQMSDAQLERTKVKIKNTANDQHFTANGEIVTFDGFLKVYLEGVDDEDLKEDNAILPPLQKGQPLQYKNITATERFSRPPYRYSEASLVKKLEELGIGRPSTYAATISRIIDKKYVEKGSVEGKERAYTQLVLTGGNVQRNELKENTGSDKGKLVPTDIGFVVNDFLVDHFERILDYNFTAKVEEDFDEIAAGSKDWQQLMKSFYADFHPDVEKVAAHADRASGERYLGEDPKSGRQVIVRLGRYGAMAQIGSPDDEQTPVYASLLPHQSITNISFEEALDLFKLPRKLGVYQGEEVEANVGRFGPYVRYGKKFVSLAASDDVFSVDLDRASELIAEKERADAPIYNYEGLGVTKGKGRFGPFIKWNGLFINVNKKYDFDNLSEADLVALIEDKKKKEAEKVVCNWPDEDIRIEKARWGRHNIIHKKIKVELSKDVDPTALSLDEVKALIESKTPKKTTRKKKTSTKAKKK